MSIRSHITDIYEHASYGSPQYLISEYLLLHWSETGQMTLSEMAEELYVSKGTLSRYIASLTQEGTYDSFCIASRKERSSRFSYISQIEADTVNYSQKIHVIHPDDIAHVSRQIRASHKVIILCDALTVSLLRPFTYLLFDMHIPAMIIPYYYDSRAITHLKNMGEKDMLLMFEPSSTSYETMSHGNLEINLPEVIDTLNCHKTVFRPSDKKGKDICRMINTKNMSYIEITARAVHELFSEIRK